MTLVNGWTGIYYFQKCEEESDARLSIAERGIRQLLNIIEIQDSKLPSSERKLNEGNQIVQNMQQEMDEITAEKQKSPDVINFMKCSYVL